jgi:signal transduction histidine kinase/ligand-binding sensor domain-containing protein
LAAVALLTPALSASAVILWSDLGATLAHDTGPGRDILGGAVKEDDNSTNTLYFKFHVDPQSDAGTEDYFAAFELYEGDAERLAVGNSLRGWAYGAFNVSDTGKTNFNVFETGTTNSNPATWGKTNNVDANWGIDLFSSRPSPDGHGGFFDYELVRKGIARTIVFEVQYLHSTNAQVTVWLEPDLGPGATEDGQMTNLTTRFKADALFNQIRLRHGGRGDGWTFSEMAIATSFSDFVMDNSGILGRGQLPFTFRLWQREQGLPQNLVRALAQTRDGYIWVGSDDGVSRFDGVRFVSFGLPEGFQAGPVQALLGDSSGTLWIGSVGRGLGRWQNGQFTSFTIKNGLPADSVEALAEDSQGRLWIGTEGGLAVWSNGRLTEAGAARDLSGKPITALFNDARGTMWIGARGAGVFVLRDGQLAALRDTGYDQLLQDPRCLLVDHDGRLWIGAGDGSVLCRQGDQWRLYRLPRHLVRHYISALAEDPEGTVWAGSVSEGLFQFRHGKLVAINASSGMSDNLVEALLVDREGKLWVGTHGGLNRLRPKNVSVLSYNDGLESGVAQGLAEVAPGLIWAGKSSEGLYLWDGRYFKSLSVAGLTNSDDHVGALLMAKDGSCWMAEARGLLQVKNPASVETDRGLMALSNVTVNSLAQDTDGAIWAGTQQGALWRLRNGQWLQCLNGPPLHALTAIVPDANNSVWVGTDGDGLYRLAANGRGHWEKWNGLLSDWVRTLHLDSEGVLWIGTRGGGLTRMAAGKMTTFTTREGLPDNTVSQILEDDIGRLWLGGNRGIVCVRKRDLMDLAEHKISEVYPQVYGREEGMLSEECISGFFPIGLKTKSGFLWFPTQQGIVVADSHHRTVNAPAPAVVLEETLVDGVPAAQPLRLAPGSHRLEFRYTGLSFDDPERVRFRYRLENLDSEWVQAGSSRSASYAYVPHGQYLFEVTACNGDGVWNTAGASLSLTVRPHLWQTWWFLGVLVIGTTISIAGTARLAVKRKLQRRLELLERERAIQGERARIAQDLHDDLGSSLTRISLLSGLARADNGVPEQVEIHVNKISQSAAQTLRALEEIVWALRPGSDTLQSLVEYIAHFADELFEENRLRCRLDLPADLPPLPLPPEMRHNIFLIVKEALTNALKHSCAREAFVQANVSRGSLAIVVHDDGKGFDSSSPSRAKGNGLGNMRRRAEAMGGALVIESAAGKGVTVRLTVPLPVAAVSGNGRAD